MLNPLWILFPVGAGFFRLCQSAVAARLIRVEGLTVNQCYLVSCIVTDICVGCLVPIFQLALRHDPFWPLQGEVSEFKYWFLLAPLAGSLLTALLPVAVNAVGSVQTFTIQQTVVIVFSTVWDHYVEGTAFNAVRTASGGFPAILGILIISFMRPSAPKTSEQDEKPHNATPSQLQGSLKRPGAAEADLEAENLSLVQGESEATEGEQGVLEGQQRVLEARFRKLKRDSEGAEGGIVDQSEGQEAQLAAPQESHRSGLRMITIGIVLPAFLGVARVTQGGVNDIIAKSWGLMGASVFSQGVSTVGGVAVLLCESAWRQHGGSKPLADALSEELMEKGRIPPQHSQSNRDAAATHSGWYVWPCVLYLLPGALGCGSLLATPASIQFLGAQTSFTVLIMLEIVAAVVVDALFHNRMPTMYVTFGALLVAAGAAALLFIPT